MSAPGQIPVPNADLTLADLPLRNVDLTLADLSRLTLSDLSRLRVLPTPEGLYAGKTYLVDTSFTRVFLDTDETEGQGAR